MSVRVLCSLIRVPFRFGGPENTVPISVHTILSYYVEVQKKNYVLLDFLFVYQYRDEVFLSSVDNYVSLAVLSTVTR